MVQREQIQEVVDLIVEVAQPEQVILFGSHARGDTHEQSDVDLLIVLPVGSDRKMVGQQVRSEFMSRRITVPTELVFRTRDQVEFHKGQFAHLMWIIDREGQELYAAA